MGETKSDTTIYYQMNTGNTKLATVVANIINDEKIEHIKVTT